MSLDLSSRSEPTVTTNLTNAKDRAIVMRRVTFVSVASNLLLTILKILVGILEHSQSLIADGIHSLSDLLSDGVILYAAHHARQGADSQHPYGHGRFETVATVVLAAMLVLVAAGLAWDATWRLFDPVSLMHPGVLALVIALLSIAAKELLYHYTRLAARRIRSDMMLANAWHHRSDAASSIVVLVGLAGTMAGLPYLDAIAAIIVAVMIANIGIELARPALQELVDTGLDAQRVQAIRNTILEVGGVRDLHMLRTRRIGGVAAADVHVLVESHLSVSEGHIISVMVEQRLKQAIEELEDVTVHIDPEDDEVFATDSLELPLRTEVLRRLEEIWQSIPQIQTKTKIVLHYLAGRIDIDLYLPLHAIQSKSEDQITSQAKTLTRTLQTSLKPHTEFNTVRIYFE